MVNSSYQGDVTLASANSAQHPSCLHRLLMAAMLAVTIPSAALAQESAAPAVPASPSPASNVPASEPPSTEAATEPESGAAESALPIPPLQFGAYADLAEGYSTNARGDAGGGAGDSFTRGTIGGFVQYYKPRLNADLSYSLTGVYWAKHHDQNHLTNRLNLMSRLIAVPDMLVVTANAFAAPADLTRLGPRSAAGEPISRFNTRDTYGYYVSPDFQLRFKDYLINNLSLSHGAVFFVTPQTSTVTPPPPIVPAQNAYSTTLTDQLTSGTYFSRLQFSVIGSYAQFSQTTQTERTAEGLVSFTYAITRWLKVFGIGGYSEFKSTTPLGRNLNGPTGLGGVTLKNGPDFTLTLEAGTQHNLPTYIGSFRWRISPLTEFVAEATDSITTPQGDILSNLARGYAGFGGIGGPSGLGNFGGNFGFGNPSINNVDTGFGSYGGGYFGHGGLALDNSIYRIRSVIGYLTHTDERMTYRVGLFGNERDRLDVTPGIKLPRTSVYGVTASASRQMNEKLSATVTASYSLGNEFGGHDRVFYVDGIANYRLSPTLDIYLTNHYDRRSSTNLIGFVNVPASEYQVILGIRAHI